MKIHVEFNSIAEMVNFSKFAGNDLVQPPIQPKRDKDLPPFASSWEDAFKRTYANLERAYERLREINSHPKISEILKQDEIKKNAKSWDEREKVKREALENDERFVFAQRALNVFKAEGIKTLKDLLSKTEHDLIRCPNMGKLTLKGIKEELAKHNLKLKKLSRQ
jgi:DNA-directed RNA polymerase alpha subunit